MDLFASQFELDSEDEVEQYAQHDFHHAIFENDDDDDDDDESVHLSKSSIKVEDKENENAQKESKMEDVDEDEPFDIFGFNRHNDTKVLEDKEEELDPITGRNARKWNYGKEEDYGGVIWKNLRRIKEEEKAKRKPKRVSQIKVEEEESKGISKIEAEEAESDCNDDGQTKCDEKEDRLETSKTDQSHSTLPGKETNPPPRNYNIHRRSVKDQYVSVDRLRYNHSNNVLDAFLRHNEKYDEFYYHPQLHSPHLENDRSFHWNNHCRMLAKLTSRLIIQNGTDHPEAIKLLSLMYKTPHEIAPHRRIGLAMVEQSIYSYAVRGRWNNEANIVKILEVEDIEKTQRYQLKYANIWKKILEEATSSTHKRKRRKKKQNIKAKFKSDDSNSIEKDDISQSINESNDQEKSDFPKESESDKVITDNNDDIPHTELKSESIKKDDDETLQSNTSFENEEKPIAIKVDKDKMETSSMNDESNSMYDFENDDDKTFQNKTSLDKEGKSIATKDEDTEMSSVDYDNNAMYDIDFAADISDAESEIVIKNTSERNLVMLDNVGRHLFKRDITHYSTLDINTVRLTLSVLLKKLGEKRTLALKKQSKRKTSNLIAEIIDISDEISSYLQMCFDHLDKLPKFLMASVKSITAELLLSYKCNSGFGIRSQSFAISEEGNEVSTLAIADGLQQATNDFRILRKLRPFSRIHLTFGIATIAANMGKRGATIIAQELSWRGDKRRTPFDLIKEALEQAENHGKLQRGDEDFEYDNDTDDETNASSKDDRSDPVDSGRLMDALELASSIFSSCIDNEPDNIIYLSWYLASLAGVMVLSSGITIGKNKKKSLLDYHINEIRIDETKFMKYQALTIKELKEIQNIIEKVREKNEDGIGPLSQYHLAIASFLEWSDAICLMMKGFVKNLDALKRMRKLHAWHTIQWALEERTSVAVRRLLDLFKSGEIKMQVLIAAQASYLESNIGKREAWLDLISFLGTVGKKICKEEMGTKKEENAENLSCDRSKCIACKYIIKEAKIDHETFDNRSIEGWWGETRKWWEWSFFSLLPSSQRFFNSNQRINQSTHFFDISHLKKTLTLDLLVMELELNGPYSQRGIGFKSMIDENVEMNWLYNEDEDEYKQDDEDDNSHAPDVMDDVLDSMSKQSNLNGLVHFTDGVFPKHINEITTSNEKMWSYIRGPNVSDTPKGRCLEMMVFKIIVACHLLGASHSFVLSSVQCIAEICCINMKKSSSVEKNFRKEDSYQSLLWLVSMGLDVPKIFDYRNKV